MIRNNNIQSNFTIFDSFHITLWGRLITKFRVEQFLRQGRKLMGYDGGRESGLNNGNFMDSFNNFIQSLMNVFERYDFTFKSIQFL